MNWEAFNEKYKEHIYKMLTNIGTYFNNFISDQYCGPKFRPFSIKNICIHWNRSI